MRRRGTESDLMHVVLSWLSVSSVMAGVHVLYSFLEHLGREFFGVHLQPLPLNLSLQPLIAAVSSPWKSAISISQSESSLMALHRGTYLAHGTDRTFPIAELKYTLPDCLPPSLCCHCALC